MSNTLRFYLNGQLVELVDPPPDLLLLDFLRSPEVGLIGAKKGCGQGGCGACTVILSRWNPESQTASHHAINSCLRPVCALQGLAVTTVEGTGAVVPPSGAPKEAALSYSRAAIPLARVSNHLRERSLAAVAGARRPDDAGRHSKRAGLLLAADRVEGAVAPSAVEGVNPVAYRLAVNNGTQCGYCSAGFVMAMSSLLVNNPAPSQREIEDSFDGNICRCTGYRPILTAMKTFASDWTQADEDHRMKCEVDPAYGTQKVLPEVIIPFPDGARAAPACLESEGEGQRWVCADSIEQLCELLRAHPDARLVHGNTSYGVYPDEFRAARVLIDIRRIAALHGARAHADRLEIGAGTTYGELIDFLAGVMADAGASETSRVGAMHFMARRTAGTIVRNAASLAGNTAMVLQHIHAGSGDPFPSDLFTALFAVGAELDVIDARTGARERRSAEALTRAATQDPALARHLVILGYDIPRGSEREIVLAQKVALREVNAHSIVNATTRLELGEGAVVDDAVVVFGGIAPHPWRPAKTEALLRGAPLERALTGFVQVAETLASEVRAELARWAARMAEVPDEGFTDEYRVELAVGFLYKAIVNALVQVAPERVPEPLRSSGVITWGRWPVSDGRQSYRSRAFEAPASVPYIKLMALYQTSGQVHYTHEIPIPPTGLNAALVQSSRALARFSWRVPGSGEPATHAALCEHLYERFDAFVDLLTCDQIPAGGINLQGMGADQPLLAIDRVSYVGQALALVLAETEQDAQDIAEYVGATCVGYDAIDWPAPWNEPVLSLGRAIEIGSIYPDGPASAPFVSHIWRITRPGSRLDWVDESRAPLDRRIVTRADHLDGIGCTVVENTLETGGQVHFYMETQACVARPEDGGRLVVHPSSQSPLEMHQTSAAALGVEQNRVRVQIRQLGGGYGGKTEQARFVTGPTALASDTHDRHVRLVMKREADTAMIGKRHPYYGQCQIALDRGEARPEDKGLIRGFDVKMWGDGGAFYDCSFIVSNNIMMRADNAYRVPSSRVQIDVCRTNKAPNTAFRAFGDIQATLITENAIDDAAFELGMRAEEVREKNLYQRGDVTPFGQALPYCYMREVWSYLKERCRFEDRRREVEAFNARNRWRKRGVAMIPVKYGSGYNLVQLEQASATVSVYSADGTILIHQGGVDMGQGAHTQVVQVAAYILNVPMALIRIEHPDTGVTPNPSSTGASTGTAYNGEAVKQACQQLRSRLTEFGYRMLDEKGDGWCREHQIDFWNHGREGWAAEVRGPSGAPRRIWQNLVQLAFQHRVNLTSQFLAPIRGGETPTPVLEYKPSELQPRIPGIPRAEGGAVEGAVDSFVGFTYSAACAVVEVDILTGETKILSADVAYDMGWSINPALDIGQVEGAFVQGIGYVLTEKLVFEPDGDERGRLNTLNTWRYKPPAVTTIPLALDVHLFPRDLAQVPENPNELLSAKEVGEPPLVLACTVFFAVKDAIRASRLERGLSGLFSLDAPATVQEVRRACEVSAEQLADTAS